ncbi:unnamed protein product [Pleuronectes platessa]|uniref:Uncharacterized protein n=1 Tax=Pleuronectes platessa TaxID=8262 RepID=A0A9N7VZ91_PLEPL|nr:unnamed protein product [Pleuronectes platessa]
MERTRVGWGRRGGRTLGPSVVSVAVNVSQLGGGGGRFHGLHDGGRLSAGDELPPCDVQQAGLGICDPKACARLEGALSDRGSP